MQRIRFNSFGAQLLLWFLLSTIVLLFGITGLLYRYTAQQIDLHVGEAAQRNVSQAMDNLSLLTRGYDSLTKSIISNTEIQRMLAKEETDPNNEYRKQLSMMSVLGSIFYSYNDIKAVHIITYSGNIYSYALINNPINKQFMESDWFKYLQSSDGNMVWGGMLEQSLTSREDRVFTFGRLLTDFYTTKPIGVILVEADPRAMVSSMHNLSFGEGSRTIVYSSLNAPLMSLGFEGLVLPEMSDLLELSNITFNEFALDASNSEQLIITIWEPQLGWRLINITPKSVIQVERNKANRYFIMIMSMSLIVAVVCATLLARSISRPIKMIVKEMMRIERGDLSTKMNTKNSYDEINYLNTRFNRMIGEINQLVERIKIKTVSEKNAQIYAMQSQINPHFLYNTLGMIYWILEEEQNKRLANVVLSLSHMYRYSSDWRTPLVPLKDELEQISHYMSIIEARLDGRIHWDNAIDEIRLQSYIPKMTLQPLIENAVIHGLADLSNNGVVKAISSEEEEHWCIHITDNGIGMTEVKLKKLQEALERAGLLEWDQFVEEEKSSLAAHSSLYSKEAKSGAGLLSVHRRLILEFGAGYGVRIESEERVFTTITVVLPYSNTGSEVGKGNEEE